MSKPVVIQRVGRRKRDISILFASALFALSGAGACEGSRPYNATRDCAEAGRKCDGGGGGAATTDVADAGAPNGSAGSGAILGTGGLAGSSGGRGGSAGQAGAGVGGQIAAGGQAGSGGQGDNANCVSQFAGYPTVRLVSGSAAECTRCPAANLQQACRNLGDSCAYEAVPGPGTNVDAGGTLVAACWCKSADGGGASGLHFECSL